MKIFIPILLLLLSGCAALTQDETADWTAERFYTEAKEALEQGNYQTATDLFAKLEARYPYGRYAEQAQLETAYAHYKAEEPAAAIAAAERFIKMHPRHPHVDYAYYIRGLASFTEGEGFFDRFVPAASQSDPTSARQAFQYFSELVNRFPKSAYAADALQRMTFLRNNLARYEIQVAEHYLKRGANLAAANRAKYVVENYPKTPSVPDALALMATAYGNMHMEPLAADALRVLRLNYPDHPALVRLGRTDSSTNNQ